MLFSGLALSAEPLNENMVFDFSVCDELQPFELEEKHFYKIERGDRGEFLMGKISMNEGLNYRVQFGAVEGDYTLDERFSIRLCQIEGQKPSVSRFFIEQELGVDQKYYLVRELNIRSHKVLGQDVFAFETRALVPGQGFFESMGTLFQLVRTPEGGAVFSFLSPAVEERPELLELIKELFEPAFEEISTDKLISR